MVKGDNVEVLVPLTGAANKVIRDTLMRNIGVQAASLVASTRQAFDPKDVNVKLVARDGGFYVADPGAGAGFVKANRSRRATRQASSSYSTCCTPTGTMP